MFPLRQPRRAQAPTALQLLLLVPRVGLAVDVPAAAPLHQVAISAALLEHALGLEALGRRQAGLEVAGEQPGQGRTASSFGVQRALQESGERPRVSAGLQ